MPMERDETALPEDIEALQSLVVSLQQSHLEQQQRLDEQQAKITHQTTLIDQLVAQIKLARHKQFGAGSERWSDDQMRLFNEAEAIDGESQESESETVEVSPHRRKRGGRKPLPDNLPTVEFVYELPESECVCPHDGAALKPIGETVTEQLDIIPAQIRILRHIRKKYACPCCDQTIKTASMPNQPIPKSRVSPGLLAYVVVNKFVDALPLHRQERIFERIGFELSRANLANWVIKAGQLVQPLINLMRDTILDYDIIGMDETRVQVLKEPGKTPQSQSYLFMGSARRSTRTSVDSLRL